MTNLLVLETCRFEVEKSIRLTQPVLQKNLTRFEIDFIRMNHHPLNSNNVSDLNRPKLLTSKHRLDKKKY